MSAQTFVLPPDKREHMIGRIGEFLASALPGKRVKVSVEAEKRPRSWDQNAALFAVCYPPLMEHMGLRGDREKEELHELMCGLYFGWDSYEILGVRKRRPRRTTTKNAEGKRDVMGILAFNEFFEFVRQKGAESGVYIPDPDPNWKERLERERRKQQFTDQGRFAA